MKLGKKQAYSESVFLFIQQVIPNLYIILFSANRRNELMLLEGVICHINQNNIVVS